MSTGCQSWEMGQRCQEVSLPFHTKLSCGESWAGSSFTPLSATVITVLKSLEPCWYWAVIPLFLLGFEWGVWSLVGLSGLRGWSGQLFNNEIMQSRSARLTRYLKSPFTALGHSQGCIQTGSSGTDLMAKLQHWRLIFNQRWVEPLCGG